jgi:pyruvate-formate lyase-activating enzyme
MAGVATIDFHITTRCSQACPYCWGPRRFRKAVDTGTARLIITRIKQVGARRIVLTGGDPLHRADAVDLIRYAREIGLETALSTTGDRLTPEILSKISPSLDLISLPLDGPSEETNARTKHAGHFSAIMRALDWLRDYPALDVKICTPVTCHNLADIPAIARLVDDYSHTTRARVFYNVFQAFPRAMFPVEWEALLVSDEEFGSLKDKIGDRINIRISFLDHETLDVLSGGRAWLGIGAGWNEREALGLGVPFPAVKERLEQLEEALQIAKQMWSDNNGVYDGKHFQLAETLCSPQPLSKPHPPILIGGSGEKKTLRLVAKYADACNLFARMGTDIVRSKLDILKRHCENVGRDYAEIEKTTLGTVHLAPDQLKAKDVIEQCRSLADLGIQHAIFNMPNVHEIKPVETFGREIIPAVADL